MTRKARNVVLTTACAATILSAGCANHKLTGYNLKTQVGQTSYEDGNRSLFTGASADFHFDVK